MPLIRTLSLGFALIFAASAHAKNEVTTFTLDNGLEGVVIEDHRPHHHPHALVSRGRCG